jgi:hypothetical protein
MGSDHYPGIRLKRLLTEAGLLDAFDAAVKAKNYPEMKALIAQVAANEQEKQRFTSVVFSNPEHYDRVISDLHYNGKTVSERLAVEGLLDQFNAAVQAKDPGRMIELLQEAAIIQTWASRLTTMIIEGPSLPPIRLNIEDVRNRGLNHVRNDYKFPPCIRRVESPRDPYWYLGSHPETVERVWDELGAALPQDCRCIVFGTPGLVAPRSGILIAEAYGTAYIIRIAPHMMAEAIQAGAGRNITRSTQSLAEMQEQYGDDWIFGKWLPREPEWLLATYRSIEGVAKQTA